MKNYQKNSRNLFMAFSSMFEQCLSSVLDKTNIWHLTNHIWSLNLNHVFKPTSFNCVASCISSYNITSSCHVHASFCCICLCFDCWHRSFSIGPTPETFQSTCLWSSASLVDLPGKQTPLFISIKPYSLAPALSYCIRTTTIHLLLCAAVVEPIPLHDLSLPQ